MGRYQNFATFQLEVDKRRERYSLPLLSKQKLRLTHKRTHKKNLGEEH